MQRLADAQTAFLRGEATPEQLHLLEQERAGEEMAKKAAEEKRRRKEAGVWARMKDNVGIGSGDLGRETNRSGQTVPRSERLLEEGYVDDGALTVNRASSGSVTPPIHDSKAEGEQEVMAQSGSSGGSLDVLAGNVAGLVTQTTYSDWMSWMRRSDKP